MTEDKVAQELKHVASAYYQGFADGYRLAKKAFIMCKDCEGYDDGRCHWWYDAPEVPSTGYCYQAERKEE